MSVAAAHAKLNLALVVGPRRPDGRHELASVMLRLALADAIELEPAGDLYITGYREDTLVREALELLARTAGVEPRWRVKIDKRIPVAAGLGGGSSDAAAALGLANHTLSQSLSPELLHELAASLGADIPFFLTRGPKLAEGDGTALTQLRLPLNYHVLVFLPADASKRSTAAVYEAFDARGGEHGFDRRRAKLMRAIERIERADDLAALPRNDLASSPYARELERLGAFRADVTGAGPAVYGLFADPADAEAAAARLAARGRTWITGPAW